MERAAGDTLAKLRPTLMAVSRPEFLAFTAFTSLRAGIDFAIRFLRRRYVTILVCLFLSSSLGILYVLIIPTSYTASAVMMIETRKNPLQSITGDLPPSGGAWIESQIEVLKSRNVATYVVRRLGLAEDPDFVSSNTGLGKLIAKLGWIYEPLSELDKLLARLGWVYEPLSEAERIDAAVARVSNGLEVRRLGQSYALEINFSSTNKEQAIKVADTMIDAYVFHQLNAKYEANRRAGDWLQERLQALREQAAAAELSVVEFKAKNKIVPAGGTLMNEKELSEISGQLAAARSQVSDVKARLERIEAVHRRYQEDQPASGSDATVIEAMTNSIITKLRTEYLELAARLDDWSVRYGKNHLAVMKLRDEVRAIRRSLNDEVGRIEEAYRSELDVAKKRQDDAEKALAAIISESAQTNHAQVALFSLEAAAQSYRKLYDSFLRQHAEAVQQQSLPTSDAQMLSPASIIKTHSRTVQVLVVTILAGGMLGVGFGVLRELIDAGFRTREQVQFALETECLALVPRLQDGSSKNVFSAFRDERSVGGQSRSTEIFPVKTIRPTLKLWRTILDAPLSPYVDAIRSIKLSLDLNLDLNSENPGLFSNDEKISGKVIGLTSCLPREGKSTMAAAMATFIANVGARVILVDCDVRNPSLSRALTPHAEVGVLELIHGDINLADAIWSDPSTGMAFLPTIINPDLPKWTEMLASGGAKSLFATLQRKYEYVIVDLAPLAAGSDVRASSRFIDTYLLVIEWGRTKMDAVQYALRNAPGVQGNIVGAVLNKVDMIAMDRYDSYSSNAYYSGRKDAPKRN